jgi:hypothetical protein
MCLYGLIAVRTVCYSMCLYGLIAVRTNENGHTFYVYIFYTSSGIKIKNQIAK